MCELFGISSKTEYEINGYLNEFYSHSNMHPHGWGLACMEGSEALIEKETIQATKSNYLKERLSLPIRTGHAFAHIRYATIGDIDPGNCHPYTKKDGSGRRWTLIHNGTIFDFSPLDKYVNIQRGSTDSERILLYIVDLVNDAISRKNRELTAKERFDLLNDIFVKMSEGNKLNILIFDGECMYVHTNYKDSLYFLDKGDGILFSTQPLDDGKWESVPFARLLAYVDEEQVFEGTYHGNEYIDNEENLKFLYQIYSSL